MSVRSRKRIINRIWIAFFAIWALILSGGLANFTNWGSPPGILQSLTLRSILRDRQDRLKDLETEIEVLQSERVALESSDWAQEKEIRSRLGYLAPDEIAFE